MFARYELARALRLNAKLAERPARLRELDDAVAQWEKLRAGRPEDWWTILGLAEALMRRGNRTGHAPDLRRAREAFQDAQARDDRPLARVGAALCDCALGWIDRDPATLRRGMEALAQTRRATDASLGTVAHTLVAEWQAAARLAHLTRDPRDARHADDLAQKAEGMLGETFGRLRDDARFLHL
ncbi:MAG: hypothetical protein QOE90_956 [Thermoplasmata archaeon]|jgi:hypothetical protein|nr:hypothetical protein [Thermoplasmata archaeon]